MFLSRWKNIGIRESYSICPPAWYKLTFPPIVTRQPSKPSTFIVQHASLCSTNERRRSRSPTPPSSRFTTKVFPHPKGCNSQLWPLLSAKKPTRTIRSMAISEFIAGTKMCCDLLCSGVLWVLRQFGVTQWPHGVMGSCTYRHVADGKENPSKKVLGLNWLFKKHKKWNVYEIGQLEPMLGRYTYVG